jgi:nitrogen fixation protein FixH
VQATELKPITRADSRRWPLIVLSLLAGHVAIMLVAVVIATHDKSFAVVSNYYDRAVNWDQSQAILRASRELGWHVQIVPATQTDPMGRRQVTFVLTDSAGRAIENAMLNVEYFHDSHASEVQNATISPTGGDGREFTQLLPIRYQGAWEFHVTVTGNGKSFVADIPQIVLNANVGHGTNPVHG